MHPGSLLALLLCCCFSVYCNIFECTIIAWRNTQAYTTYSTNRDTQHISQTKWGQPGPLSISESYLNLKTVYGAYIFTHTIMRLLTSGGHQTDDDGGGGGWALNQHSHQDAHHQPCHGVGEHRVVLENVPRHFTWLNMPPTYTHKLLVSDMTGLPRAMLNKTQSARIPESKKVSRRGFAVNYTAQTQ